MLTPLGAMKLAIEEGRKGLGFVAPNPPVGCVILDKNGDLLAKGFHRIYGGDHAEIDALKQVVDESTLERATLYVTLEPCAHEGKTPSCAKHLAQLPLKKVVYGLRDPNPLVSGAGAEILRQAGIEAEEYDGLKNELEELPEAFLWNQRRQGTFVALKVATSLDGQLAHVSGDSKWITGEDSRQYSHYLRAIYDAVLVGKGTFLADNPALNIRHNQFIGKKNKVIILDGQGDALPKLQDSNLLKHHDWSDVYVVVAESITLPASKAQILPCGVDSSGRIDLGDMLKKLWKAGITSVFVEGGARVLSSLLQSGHVQRYYQFIAPQIIGARSGISFTSEFSIETLPDRRELRNPKTMSFGHDLLITGRLDE